MRSAYRPAPTARTALMTCARPDTEVLPERSHSEPRGAAPSVQQGAGRAAESEESPHAGGVEWAREGAKRAPGPGSRNPPAREGGPAGSLTQSSVVVFSAAVLAAVLAAVFFAVVFLAAAVVFFAAVFLAA